MSATVHNFCEWWDTSKASATPETYSGWEESCRQAWAAGARFERERWRESALAMHDAVLDTMASGRPIAHLDSCADDLLRLLGQDESAIRNATGEPA